MFDYKVLTQINEKIFLFYHHLVIFILVKFALFGVCWNTKYFLKLMERYFFPITIWG